MSAPVEVRSVIGHKQTGLAIRCLSSLVQTSVEEITIALHDDGSLTSDDISLLRDRLPISIIVSREEADEQVRPLLKDYKWCSKYRETNVWMTKLFDIPLLSGPELYYCDADVLFLAPHRGLFAGTLSRTQAVFMQDLQHAYSLRPYHIWPFSRVNLRSRLNSGLFAFQKSAYKLEFLDRFFAAFASDPYFENLYYWQEQTAWSALSTQANCLFFDPAQIAIASPSFQYQPDNSVALHFVGPTRHLMEDYKDLPRESDVRIDIRLVKPAWFNGVRWYVENRQDSLRAKLNPVKKAQLRPE